MQLSSIAPRNIEPFTIQPITHTNLNRIDIIETIEIGNRKLIDAIDHSGVASRNRVEPSAAPRASSRRAELTPHPVQHLSEISIFGRQSALPYARRIRLHH